MDAETLALEFPNVGEGADPTSIADLAAASEFVALLLMQSPRSGTCRQQVREVAEEYDRFDRVDATVAAVVPGPHRKLRRWRRLVDPPFPVLADEDGAVGETFFQSTRYGRIGRFAPSIGRAPATVLLDCRAAEPTPARVYEGETSFDRPTVDDLVAAIESLRA